MWQKMLQIASGGGTETQQIKYIDCYEFYINNYNTAYSIDLENGNIMAKGYNTNAYRGYNGTFSSSGGVFTASKDCTIYYLSAQTSPSGSPYIAKELKSGETHNVSPNTSGNHLLPYFVIS